MNTEVKEKMVKEEKARVPMVGFKVPRDRKRLLDRKDFTDENGTVDYVKLVKKVDELGERLMMESRMLDELTDNINMQRRVNQELDRIRRELHA